MHPRCVHAAENARSSPDAVRTMMPGRLPNLKIFAEFGASSSGANGSVTVDAADSALLGGTRYRATG
jgi:hypothetical protein